MFVEFRELKGFSELVEELLTLEEYRNLQLELLTNPFKGDVIQHTGGARKIRVAGRGKGKRGGLRAIYYLQDQRDRIWFLFLYAKSEKENLSHAETNAIYDVVKAVKELDI
jgi:hypothetical protein